jgi:hypothetical protein
VALIPDKISCHPENQAFVPHHERPERIHVSLRDAFDHLKIIFHGLPLIPNHVVSELLYNSTTKWFPKNDHERI